MTVAIGERTQFSLNAVISTLQLPEGKTKFQRFKTFMKDVLIAAKNKIKEFFVGMYQHAEAITVVTLSSFGLSALLGELPFWVALPWWIETVMVIPLISVAVITILLWNGERRAVRRLSHAQS
jgi:hypothetical protein